MRFARHSQVLVPGRQGQLYHKIGDQGSDRKSESELEPDRCWPYRLPELRPRLDPLQLQLLIRWSLELRPYNCQRYGLRSHFGSRTCCSRLLRLFPLLYARGLAVGQV